MSLYLLLSTNELHAWIHLALLTLTLSDWNLTFLLLLLLLAVAAAAVVAVVWVVPFPLALLLWLLLLLLLLLLPLTALPFRCCWPLSLLGGRVSVVVVVEGVALARNRRGVGQQVDWDPVVQDVEDEVEVVGLRDVSGMKVWHFNSGYDSDGLIDRKCTWWENIWLFFR